ncbi:hypothetical protein Gotur_021230 [Gossypium turneri]
METRDAHILFSMRRVYHHFGGRAITIGITDTFPESMNDSTKVERIRYAQVYILEMIGGYLMLDLSQNLVHLRWLLKLVDFRATGELSWGLLQNRRLPITTTIMGSVSLSIFTSSSEPPIYIPTHNEAVISDEFFQNLNIWHVKVSLVNYATVDMHQTDRAIEYELAGILLEYIKFWENRYDHIPTRESIIIPELAYAPDYMPWFKINGKPYLLSEEQRRRQIRVKRERRGPLNPRRRDDDTGPLTAPT